MFKKALALFMVFTLLFVVVTESADAKPRRSVKSPKQSYTQTPKKDTNNVSQSNPGSKSGSTANTTAKRGFFSGGSFMKGLMIGGLAGLLFGGIFSNMGFFGNLIGLLLNVFAIFALFALIRAAIQYFRRNRTNHDNRRRY
ncbi:import inner membrane translocase subunit Tim44 [Paenibacillus curdlanolyticus YK9]|uniref:Import inner membrane translocase subunit Tim44 n=1 Tax=Paenibacillus curdlanolyticus YK9 TaxID=717606 RepID=E0I510_9BACL|nr:hypothetical protein [Paenibacillus curdlanolyticus]EFM12052.1 import inner membrane translocase subunit Tim44 [Paenibacillus curdlanolyticus YK9]